MNLHDDAALLSFEHQLHLEDVLGEHSYYFNMDEQRFEFGGEHPRRCTRFHLLGTAAPGPQSWLWSWADPGDDPEPLLAAARSVRDFGLQYQITELHQEEVPFSQVPGGPAEPRHAMAVMIDAAKAVCGQWTSYNPELDSGTWICFLVEHPDFRLPPPEPQRVARVLTEGLAELAITDHWRALHSYAVRRPLGVSAADDHSQMVLTSPGLDLTVSFDALGRVAGMNGTLGPVR